jgi:hypothetical protein
MNLTIDLLRSDSWECWRRGMQAILTEVAWLVKDEETGGFHATNKMEDVGC